VAQSPPPELTPRATAGIRRASPWRAPGGGKGGASWSSSTRAPGSARWDASWWSAKTAPCRRRSCCRTRTGNHIQGLPHFQAVLRSRQRGAHLGLAPGNDVARGDPAPADGPGCVPVPLDALSAKLTCSNGAGRVQGGDLPGAGDPPAPPRHHPRLSAHARGRRPGHGVRDRQRARPGGHYETPASVAQGLRGVSQGAELLIHDAMYTPEELEEHRDGATRRSRRRLRWRARRV